MKDASVGDPYPSAKEHYILDIENKEFAKDVITKLETVIPIPKPRKKAK